MKNWIKPASIALIASLAFTTTSNVLANTKKSSLKQSMSNSFQTGNHVFVGLGIDAYLNGFPSFSPTVTRGGSNTRLFESYSNHLAAMHTATIGYHFVNPGFLNSIFGKQNAIELTGSQLNMDYDQGKTGGIGNGRIWYIDGRTFGVVAPFLSYKLKTDILLQNLSLAWTGHKQLNNAISMTPSVGLVYSYLKQNYDWKMRYNSGLVGNEYENYRLRTLYSGVSVGDTFNFTKFRQFTPFAGINLQLLHGVSVMKAYQTPLADTNPPGNEEYISVHNSTRALLTFRAIAQTGFNYYLFSRANSPYFTFSVGADYWQWAPQIITPHSSGSAAHIKTTQTIAGFAGLKFTVPLV